MKPNKPLFSEMLSMSVCLGGENFPSLSGTGGQRPQKRQELWAYKEIKSLRSSGEMWWSHRGEATRAAAGKPKDNLGRKRRNGGPRSEGVEGRRALADSATCRGSEERGLQRASWEK